MIQLIRLTAKRFPKRTGVDLIALANRLGAPAPSDERSLTWLEIFNQWLTDGKQLATCVAIADLEAHLQTRREKTELFGILYGK